MEWHTLPKNELLGLLDTSEHGLREEEAAERLIRYGPNSIEIKKKISPLSIFIHQFNNLLVLVLLSAAFISLGISILQPGEADIFDAVLIFGIVLANAVFGFFQEYKAEQSIEALTRMSAPKARVLRDGREQEIHSLDVVPGDVLLLGEGDKVAADARILEAHSLYADESSLTGESMPSEKEDRMLDKVAPLAERSNLLFMNSVITRGRGRAVVTQTGLTSEIGQIAKEISEAPKKITQFQIEIEDLGRKVSIITLAILVVIAASQILLQHKDLLFVFITAVALGVAAIPEGLPAVVTLSLSFATNRMLKKHALTRRLSTVQDLGSIDTICTDKTGTLTENVMTVTRIWTPGKGVIEVKGKGHDMRKNANQDTALMEKDMIPLMRCALLCNDSRIAREGGREVFKGDPTEIAILIAALKAGLDIDSEMGRFERVGENPFSSERKLMSTMNEDANPEKNADTKTKTRYSFVKGAPEVLLGRCDRIIGNGGAGAKKLSDAERRSIMAKNDEMAGNALRVLGFAYKENPASDSEKDAENGLIFLGLMGMIDPPREGVKQAIADCRSAGIRVIMITGDNKLTAEAVGHELGFKGKAMTGAELDSMDERSLERAFSGTDIFARTAPKHKVMILRHLQKRGHVVCMTGDGVNDAAAIKNSDVGVSMGIRGTEVTKQASDMILLDDNFVTIHDAIKEGRGTFDNIRKFVVYLLGANIAEVLIIFISSISGFGIAAKIAIQLLWINLVTDGLPALALGVDPPGKDIMRGRPRQKGERVVDMPTLSIVLSIGMSATAAICAVYAYMLSLGDTAKAQTVLFTMLVLLEMLVVYVVRWIYKSDLLSNMWLHLAVASSILLQLLIIYTPLNSLFGIVPLGIAEAEVIGAGLLGFLALLAVPLAISKKLFPEKTG